MKKLLFFVPLLGLLLSGPARAQRLPAAPTNLTGAAPAYNQITLNWTDNANNETKFEIEYNGFASWSKVGEVAANVTTYTRTGADVGGGYRVRAVNAAGASGYSNEITLQTPPEPPAPPSGLGANAQSANSIRVTWSNGGGGTPDNYLLERGTSSRGPFSQIATVSYSRSPSYDDNGLSAGTNYCYRVRARNGGGTSDYSSIVCATTQAPPVPADPARLNANAVSVSQINLDWADVSNNETGFDIERAANAGGPFAKIGEVGANSTTYADQGLGAATQYCYRVRAKNGAGTSSYSNTACATTQSPPTPSAPTDLNASAVSTSQINLTWNTSATFGDGYEVERASSPGGPFSKIADVNGQGNRAFSDQNLAPGTQYCYRVRAKYQGQFSGFSSTVCATTQALPPPNAPTRLAANAASATQINLSWVDNAGDETSYEVERGANAGGPFAKVADLGANATSYADQNLNASTQYCYRVRAVRAGAGSNYDGPACATTQAPPVTIPAAPSSLAATAASPSQVNLTWADNAGNETGYDVERSTDGTNFSKIADLGANATSHADNGLNAATKYFYRVRAKNGAGASGYSNIADATTPAPPVVTPAAPTSLTATGVSSTQINLAWSSTATFGDYEVERAANSGGPFTKIADVVGSGNRSFSDQNLSPSTQYCYRVRAKSGGQVSDYSNTACATTQAPPVVTPRVPSNLTATAVSSSQVNLTWTDNANNETGFDIERAANAGGPFAKIADVAADATVFEDKNLTPSTQYCYRVRARNAAGTSDYTPATCATTLAPPVTVPAAPSDLTASAVSPTQVNLAWKDNAGNETGFEVERASSSNGPFTKIGEVGANVTAFEDKNLAATTAYCYRVRAKNSAGASAYTATACATTPQPVPGPPTGLQAQLLDYDQIKVSWAGTTGSTAYLLERSTSPAGGFTPIGGSLPGTQTSYLDENLPAETTFYYRLRATNAAGASAYSPVVNAKTGEVVIGLEKPFYLSPGEVVYVDTRERTLHLALLMGDAPAARIRLYTLNGGLAHAETQPVQPTWFYERRLTTLPPGVYVLHLETDSRQLVKKIVLP